MTAVYVNTLSIFSAPTPAPTPAPKKLECPQTLQCMLACKDGYQLGSAGPDGCPHCSCLAREYTKIGNNNNTNNNNNINNNNSNNNMNYFIIIIIIIIAFIIYLSFYYYYYYYYYYYHYYYLRKVRASVTSYRYILFSKFNCFRESNLNLCLELKPAVLKYYN